MAPCVISRTNGLEELFFSANQAYKQGRFQEAIKGYCRLIQSDYRNGHLYYNLGNAYFRLNELGRAILSYERAGLLMPRDADLNFNLRNARDKTRDAVTESQTVVGMTFFWLKALSLSELLWGFAVMNLLFWTILLIRLFLKRDLTYYLSLLILFLWLMAGASFGLKWYEIGTDDRAVILEQEVNILAGPDIRDTVLFKLHEGTVVCHERSENGWSLVRLPDKKRGWVKADALELITIQTAHFLPTVQHGCDVFGGS